jgi:hypothetical protein
MEAGMQRELSELLGMVFGLSLGIQEVDDFLINKLRRKSHIGG